MLPWIEPPRMIRPVASGRVRCPRDNDTVDVARCRSCPYLDEVVVDDGGTDLAITCAPSFGSLAATPLGVLLRR